jgi:anaphase-promoting complex subunit 1
MASVQSLGHHEPTALPYLIAEGILQPDPLPESYKWHSYLAPAGDGSGLLDEEITIAQSCVVWSRCGIIKRVLNLDTEGEQVLKAFTTSFPTKDEERASGDNHKSSRPRARQALVVVLKTQAHLLLLSGDSHVLPLPFEVESAFPCPYGFILQRTVNIKENQIDEVSFHHDLSTINESQGTLQSNSGRPSLLLPNAPQSGPSGHEDSKGMPRTYSCTEIMSELGLVVYGSSKLTSLDDCPALRSDEDILFISGHDELYPLKDVHAPLCIAVSKNRTSGKITIWHVARHVPLTSHTQPRAKKPTRKSEASRRKSSNIYARNAGAATPVPRGPSKLRESFGAPAPLNAENLLHSSATEQPSLASDDLAAQFGPGFGEVGVQTRSARRVSSMLARTDLGAGHDRGAFHDLAMGHGTRKSLNRPGNRGESVGSFGDRQSFGRRRSSFPATTSILSTGTSFLNAPSQLRASILETSRGVEGLDDSSISEGGTHLPREVGFFKLTSFSMSDEGASLLDGQSGSFKVLTFLSPSKPGQYSTELSVCVLDQAAGLISIVNVQVESTPSIVRKESETSDIRLKATKIRRGSGIAGACTVFDEMRARLMILTRTRQSQTSLQLEAPWSAPFRIDLPQAYRISSPIYSSFHGSPSRGRDEGARRVLSQNDVEVSAIETYGTNGQMLMADSSRRRHLLALRLHSEDATVRDIIKLSNLIFGSDYQDSFLVAFWEVLRWLKNREVRECTDWTAMLVLIFSLAVPFVDHKHSKTSTPQKRKKGGLLRSSSGTAVDLTNFTAMREVHAQSNLLESPTSAWDWLLITATTETNPTRSPKHGRSQSLQSVLDDTETTRSRSLLQCIAWAREFVQSPAGEAAIGPEGYLPISINKDQETRQTCVAKFVVGLHLLTEEYRLNVAETVGCNPRTMYTAVLAQLGQWLGWADWTVKPGGYYFNETSGSDRWLIEETRITGLETPGQPFPPPSIFQHIVENISGQCDEAFPTLELLLDQSANSRQAKDILLDLTPRTWSLLSFIKLFQGGTGPVRTIELMKTSLVQQSFISTILDGVGAAFHQALASCKSRSASDSLLSSPDGLELEQSNQLSKLQLPPSHDANKDHHSLSLAAIETETLQRWDASSEADRHTITRLIFQEDRRFQEASRLVNQTRPPVVECTPEPQWSEADLLEAQKELVQFVTRRTLSVASGRGMMHFNARVPLLTERVPIPAFSLQCVMKPRYVSESAQTMTFSADKASFTEDKVCWAFFHNGASAGLMISKDAKGIDTSWVLYNKPPDLTNRHAGFLLALGLNGHLKNLAKWVAFKYLTPKHTMTSIGLLLGLSASYLGTQDQLVTRMLSVHVTRLLPPGSTELNVSPLTQTTGIMGIGLLYYNSQHRRMSEVMISELENNDAEDGASEESILRDEGYRLAAGFSLGLINLGQGKRLHGLHDMSITERLLSIAVGTKNVNLVHVLDRATAGAVMAIALIFLKTNDRAIARKIDIPDTIHQFDYVRPDIFLLRTLARHLVMWDSMVPTKEFIETSLPRSYRSRATLHKTVALHTEDMPFYNILTGVLFGLGLRFAGSQSPVVRDLLVSYLDQFLRLSRLPCLHYDARVTLNSVRNCLDVIALATASVMAGSGDLIILRRLRSLHGRTDKDTPFGSHMASHMAIGTLFLGGGTMTFGTSDLAVAGLCIAFYPLFPGDVLDNKTHLQALRHLWVVAVEGRCLVARTGESVVGGIEGCVKLRNGEEMKVRAPGLLPEFDAIGSLKVTGEGYWDVILDFSKSETLEKVKREGAVNVQMTRKANYDKLPKPEVLLEALNTLEEERRIGGKHVPSVDANVAIRTHGPGLGAGDPFEWLFGLESFKHYDYKERDLVLNSLNYLNATGREMLEGTVVDQRLNFERGCLPERLAWPVGHGTETGGEDESMGDETLVVERDKLWQIRLLLEWFDRFEREDEEMQDEDVKWASGQWIRREVVEDLRERVWKLAGGLASKAPDEA